jgi:hypothetical protein
MSNLQLGVYVFGSLFALGLLAYVSDRVLLWMERRGWIYYRTFEPRIKDGVRSAMSTFQEIVQPEIKHVHEEQSQRRAETDEASPSDR